jgi:DNA-binding CsgD family transcriptional regulator
MGAATFAVSPQCFQKVNTAPGKLRCTSSRRGRAACRNPINTHAAGSNGVAGINRAVRICKNPRIPTVEKINHETGCRLYTHCMPQKEHHAADSSLPGWTESAPADENSEIVQLSAARARAPDEATAAIARQLNGPLTALMLYMNEIKQHSGSQNSANRLYLQQVVDNALHQTERVYALVKQLCDNHPGLAAPERKAGADGQAGRARGRMSGVMLASESEQKPLTRREREVLALISEGCSNKQGALRMSISPRTFESHRAEAMRKLGARNTADLVRKALLLHPAVG